MFFASTGGIFLRLDSSGNLNIFDTTGTSIAKFVGGLFSGRLNAGTYAANAKITTTTSTTYVATGDNWTITPQIATSVWLASLLGTVSNSIATDGVQFGYVINAGSTTIAGATAEAGANNGPSMTSATANAQVPIFFWQQISGLTVGTQYVVSLCVKANTGGTASWTAGQLAVLELT